MRHRLQSTPADAAVGDFGAVGKKEFFQTCEAGQIFQGVIRELVELQAEGLQLLYVASQMSQPRTGDVVLLQSECGDRVRQVKMIFQLFFSIKWQNRRRREITP